MPTTITRMLTTLAAGGLALGAAGGCTKTPAYLYGIDLTDVKIGPPISTQEGVWPDSSVLDDPSNPFKGDPPSSYEPDGGPKAGKWQIQGQAGPAASFYSWASVLATEPNGDGESQFYAADNLYQALNTGALDANVNRDAVKALALAGYESVIDNYPGSVTYLTDGKTSVPLDNLAVQGIVNITGIAPPDWVNINGQWVKQ